MRLLHKLTIFILVLTLISANAASFAAGSATMTLSTASKTVDLGSNFSVNVAINPSGSAVDTARMMATFTSGVISVVGITLTGVLDSPSPGNGFNNSAGTISWGGFTVARQLNTAGSFARITFRANTIGDATLTLDGGSRIISNGEEVSNPAAFNQVKVSVVEGEGNNAQLLGLSSSTHPDQATWYQATTAQFKWSSIPEAAYLWEWDHDPETIPTQRTDDLSKTLRNIKSGVWYFHLQAKLPNGDTMGPAHYRVQVDNVKPNPIEPYLDVNDQQQLTVRFATTDYHSGIANYDLRVNQQDIENASNPYVLRGLNIGENFIVVTAYDLGGNVRQGWVKFILNPDGTIRDITVSQEGCSLPFGCDTKGYLLLFGLPPLLIIGVLIYLRFAPRRATSAQTTPTNTTLQSSGITPDGVFTRTKTHTHTHTYTDTDIYTDTAPKADNSENVEKSTEKLEKRTKKGSNAKRKNR